MVFFLNYLIAIVSDSFENVTENQALAIQNGRHALNGDHLKSNWSEPERDIELLVMATTIIQVDAEWQGVSKSVKKRIDVTDKLIEERFGSVMKHVSKINEIDARQKKFEERIEQLN